MITDPETDSDIRRLVALRNDLMTQMRALENQVIGMNRALSIVEDEIKREAVAGPTEEAPSDAQRRKETRHYRSDFEPT